jgi:thiamine biosynthesis lipoprotein
LSWNRPVIVFVLVGLVFLSLWEPRSSNHEVQRSRLLLGTVVEITSSGLPEELSEKAIDHAFQEISRLEKLLSTYEPESDLTRLSQSEEGTRVARETAELLALGKAIAQQSDGAFDMTLGRLKSLWDFESGSKVIPNREAIHQALEHTGPESLVIMGQNVQKKHPALAVDLGGIAKGYIVDRAVDILKSYGINSGAVNAGGDMFLIGNRFDRPWRIGIQHPREAGQVLATVEVADQAVVTSGDYERYFMVNGQRFHHIFDPRTGMPSRASQSVTVVSAKVALADGLATAIFVLGPQRGLDLITQYPGSECLIIGLDGTEHHSPGWQQVQVSP